MNSKDLLASLPEAESVVSVLSGGLDSSVLTYLLTKAYKRVEVLSFSYGQRHGDRELDCARSTCEILGLNHQTYALPCLGINRSALAKNKVVMPTIKQVLGVAQSPTYVPNRNRILADLAVSYAEDNDCTKVFLGLQCHDEYQYWDCSPHFVKKMNEVSLLNREHYVELVAPFINFSKQQEILIGKDLGVDFSKTWTCYSGPDDQGRACGKCPSCSERIMNFAKAGFADLVPYAVDLDWDFLIKKYKD
jgi:7-cyano-7-deazaguanine synthase